MRTVIKVTEKLLGVLAVVLDVRLSPQYVGELLLRAGSYGLVELELRNGRLARTGNVLVSGLWIAERHGCSFSGVVVSA